MGSYVLWALKNLFTRDIFVDSITNYMKNIIEALYTIIVENEIVKDSMSAFAAIAGALVTVRFLTETIVASERELLNFHRFVQMMIRTFAIMIMLFCAQPIAQGIFGIGWYAYELNARYNVFTGVSGEYDDDGDLVVGVTNETSNLHGYDKALSTDSNGGSWENDASKDNIMFNIGGWVFSESELSSISPHTTPDELSYDITADPCGLMNNKKIITLNSYGDAVEATEEGEETDIQTETQEEDDESLLETIGESEANSYYAINDAIAAADESDTYHAITKTFKGVLNRHYGIFKNFYKNNEPLLLVIPAVIKTLILLVCLLECVKNATNILIKSILSPLAIANSFGEGTNMSGIKFLKSLLADAMTMGLIIMFINAGNFLSGELMRQTVLADCNYIVSCETLSDILDLQGMLMFILPELAVLGGIASANRLANLLIGE